MSGANTINYIFTGAIVFVILILIIGTIVNAVRKSKKPNKK